MNQDRIKDDLLASAAPRNAWLGSALLWQPSYTRDDNMLWHVPFLFWLLEKSPPKKYVQIGIGEGVAYLAVCQALHRMRVRSCCVAIAEWTDGEEAGGAPERIHARNSELYGDFSQIIAEDFGTAADAFDDGAVDLMLLDLTIAPQATASFHRRWYPKLSKNGVLLVNGVDSTDEGVIVLVNALSATYRTVRLPGGNGLLVVLPGTASEEAVPELASLAPEDAARELIIEMFTRLGASSYHSTNAPDLNKRVQTLDEKAKRLWKERTHLAEQLGTLREQYDARHLVAATLQSRYFDTQQELSAALTETERLTTEVTSFREELEQTRASLLEESSSRTQAENAVDEKTGEIKELNVLLAVLRQHLEDEQEKARVAFREKQDDKARFRNEATEAGKFLEQERATRVALEKQVEGLIAELEERNIDLATEKSNSELSYQATKSLIELAEQRENIILALSEELRLVREDVRACLAAPIGATLGA